MTLVRRKIAIGMVAAGVALVAALLASPSVVGAADHLDAPLVANDGRTDINDVYVFTSPANPDNTVLIMTVNPVAGVISDTTFDRKAKYEILIDRDGDAAEDTTYQIRFKKPEGGTQEVRLRTKGDKPRLRARGETGEVIETTRGGTLTAGIFDDPFFFDLVGFQNGLAFTGDDFFAGLNVSAIVLEVPSSALGSPGDTVGVWARTIRKGDQIDRMGRPVINTVLIPSGSKDAFNAGEPEDDPADFGDEVRASITALSGGDADFAATITDVLLPDVNTYTVGDPDGFLNLNGRQLADDVIDIVLNLLTQGAVSGDGVDVNDVPFLGVFPYLAPAH